MTLDKGGSCGQVRLGALLIDAINIALPCPFTVLLITSNALQQVCEEVPACKQLC